MSQVLNKIGLSAGRVRALLGTPQPSNVAEVSNTFPNYWYGPSQKQISTRLSCNEKWIVSQYLIKKRKPEVIAKLIGVSVESVRKRLRKLNLFNSKGKAGRPFTRSEKDF